MKKALVTLAVGEHHSGLFEKYCLSNWQEYCYKFDFELIVIKSSLDESVRGVNRSVAWQKLLILSQTWSSEYDQIVWVDSDVVINSEYAYDITEGVPVDKVGAVDTHSIPTKEIFALSNLRLEKIWDGQNINHISGNFYTTRGIPGEHLTDVVQTGVFVCSPTHHKAIFEYIYNHYEDTKGAEWNYEMPAMSYELLTADLITWISPRFNFCVSYILTAFYPEVLDQKSENIKSDLISRIIRKLTNAGHNKIETINPETQALKNIYGLSIFMHFAGCSNLMSGMKDILK